MKVLIWLGSIIIASLIRILLQEHDIILGGIPTFILFAGMFGLATFLCKELDIHRGVNVEGNFLEENPNRITECKSCGYRDKNFFNACPKCGKYAKQYVYLNDENPVADQIRFCRKCGQKLNDISRFCNKCGTEIIEDTVAMVEENWEFCKKCGADISDDIGNCHVCGEIITRVEN